MLPARRGARGSACPGVHVSPSCKPLRCPETSLDHLCEPSAAAAGSRAEQAQAPSCSRGLQLTVRWELRSHSLPRCLAAGTRATTLAMSRRAGTQMPPSVRPTALPCLETPGTVQHPSHEQQLQGAVHPATHDRGCIEPVSLRPEQMVHVSVTFVEGAYVVLCGQQTPDGEAATGHCDCGSVRSAHSRHSTSSSCK